MARPTKLTPEIREEICTRIAGGESLVSVCTDDHMPARSTVMLWVVRDTDGFWTEYAQAREAAGFAHADEVVSLGKKAIEDGIDPQAVRAATDSLKWAAERMAPKKHSPRQEVTGKEGEPVQTESTVKADQLDNETLAKLMAAKQNDGDSPDTD